MQFNVLVLQSKFSTIVRVQIFECEIRFNCNAIFLLISHVDCVSRSRNAFRVFFVIKCITICKMHNYRKNHFWILFYDFYWFQHCMNVSKNSNIVACSCNFVSSIYHQSIIVAFFEFSVFVMTKNISFDIIISYFLKYFRLSYQRHFIHTIINIDYYKSQWLLLSWIINHFKFQFLSIAK